MLAHATAFRARVIPESVYLEAPGLKAHFVLHLNVGLEGPLFRGNEYSNYGTGSSSVVS
jgi:hypothetical protein